MMNSLGAACWYGKSNAYAAVRWIHFAGCRASVKGNTSSFLH
ncbi:hypothetical protein HMPREF3036_01281 [Sutterella sp. KLE1602]|nr:hypothetical protein HMPREF3036_01281 [Sutterella sp. KLE1602]